MPRGDVDDQSADLTSSSRFQVLADDADVPAVYEGIVRLKYVPCLAYELMQGEPGLLRPRRLEVSLLLLQRLWPANPRIDQVLHVSTSRSPEE